MPPSSRLSIRRSSRLCKKTASTPSPKNKDVAANADATEKELKDEKAVIAKAEQKREELTQSITTLKSTGATMERDASELDGTLKGQDEEFAELNKTLKEVNRILAGSWRRRHSRQPAR